MISGESQKPLQKAARWLCGVCGRGVGSNSIQCTSCHKWVHKKCSGIRGSMYKVMSFICRVCSNPVISTGYTSVDIGASANLEVVDKFCYLGRDMLSVDGDADCNVKVKVRVSSKELRERLGIDDIILILTLQALSVLATAIPSICLSVTCWYCVKTTALSTVQFALSDSKMCLVL